MPSCTVAYVWHASAHACEVQAGLERVGFEVRQQIIWDKGLFALSRQHYNWQHEPCLYATRRGRAGALARAAEPVDGLGGGEPEDGYRRRARASVMRKVDHPTQKPVVLVLAADREPPAAGRGGL